MADHDKQRLPEFSARMLERLPGAVSQIAFIDKWLLRRMDEARRCEDRLGERLEAIAQAENRLAGMLDATREFLVSTQAVKNEWMSSAASLKNSVEEILATGRQSAEKLSAKIRADQSEFLSTGADSLAAAQREASAKFDRIEQEISRRAKTYQQQLAMATERYDRGAAASLDGVRERLQEQLDNLEADANEAIRPIFDGLVARVDQLMATIRPSIHSAETPPSPLSVRAIPSRETINSMAA